MTLQVVVQNPAGSIGTERRKRPEERPLRLRSAPEDGARVGHGSPRPERLLSSMEGGRKGTSPGGSGNTDTLCLTDDPDRLDTWPCDRRSQVPQGRGWASLPRHPVSPVLRAEGQEIVPVPRVRWVLVGVSGRGGRLLGPCADVARLPTE